jgi:hypothetical protein
MASVRQKKVTVILWFTWFTLILTGCRRHLTAGELHGESLSDEDAARIALFTFFEHLHAGEYAAAVDLYGGSYETMIAHNPTIDPSDRAALFRAACLYNGAQCLQVASARLQTDTFLPEGVFRFSVEFVQEDNTIFLRGPCCGEEVGEASMQGLFTYEVRKFAEYLFEVLDPPIYAP